MPKKTNKLEQLENMCIEIFAHAQNDWEIALSCNGINACEASGVAWAILDIIHGEDGAGRKWQDAHRNRIQDRAKELREAIGDYDDDE